MLSKASIPEIYQHQSIIPSYYDVENTKKIYSFYGQNRMDIFEGSRNEWSKLIKASQECFLKAIRWLSLSTIEKRMSVTITLLI